MKTSKILKILSLLGFLILLAPFYDSCSNSRIKKVSRENPIVNVDSTTIEKNSKNVNLTRNIKIDTSQIVNTKQDSTIPFYKQLYEFIDDPNSENAFEFASLNSIYLYVTLDEFKKGVKSGIKENDYKSFFFALKNFCFLLIIFLTILISYFAFNKNKSIYKLAKINLILTIITVICLFLEGFFETITQFKWGYYAFIFINFILLYYSKKLVRPNF